MSAPPAMPLIGQARQVAWPGWRPESDGSHATCADSTWRAHPQVGADASCFFTADMLLAGSLAYRRIDNTETAKFSPSPLALNEFTPNRLPDSPIKGPPELPGLIGV